MSRLIVRAFRSRACRLHGQHIGLCLGSVSPVPPPFSSPVLRRCSSTWDGVNYGEDFVENVQWTLSDKEFEDQWKARYEVWKEGKGPPPRDVLLDASGHEIVSPKIDPDFRIQGGNDGKLPPALQHAVDQHVYWACQHEHVIPRDRHIARHFRMDSRVSLKKTKKKALMKDLVITPFVLIGAYQQLLKRAQQYPYGSDEEDPAGHRIRTANISFRWFQTVSRIVGQVRHSHGIMLNTKNAGKAYIDPGTLIVNEAMAMLMQPIVTPFLPSHSWYLASMDMEKGVMGDGWKYVPGTQRVENLARKLADYDTSKHSLLLWDMGVDGDLVLTNQQVKMIINMVTPYASPWWSHHLHRQFTALGQGVRKKSKWTITEDKYSSLPSLLADMLFLRLDNSDTLIKHPLLQQMRQAQRSDKKGKMGVVNIPNVPKKTKDSGAHTEYHRWGWTVCLLYKGPEKLKDKLVKAVSLELKSAMHFDKKLVGDRGISQKEPSKKLTAKEKKELKQAEAKFAEQALRVDIATAGTKSTKNRRRTDLQKTGRSLEEQGLLHLDKTFSARTPGNAEQQD